MLHNVNAFIYTSHENAFKNHLRHDSTNSNKNENVSVYFRQKSQNRQKNAFSSFQVLLYPNGLKAEIKRLHGGF